MQTTHHHRTHRLLGLMTAALLVCGACGSQHNRSELLGADGGAKTTAPGAGTDPAAYGAPAAAADPGSAAPDAATAATTPVAGAAAAPAGSAAASASAASGTKAPASRTANAPAVNGQSSSQPRSPSQSSGGSPGAAPAPSPGVPGVGGGGGGAQPAPGAVKGAPLKVGMLSTLTGPIGATLAGGTKGAQAWVAYINAAGGLNGHPVELTLADDSGDPARNRSQAQYLVEQKGDVGILMSSAPVSGQGSVSYFQEKRIPVVGTEGCSPWVTRNSMYFPQMSSDPLCADVTAQAMGSVLIPQNKKKIALIYCVEISGCTNLARSSAFTAVGFEVVYKASVSLAAPDFTAQCLAARNAGAEALYMAFDTQSVGRLADNCASVSFKPVYGHPGQIAADTHLKNPNLDGDTIGFPTAPWFDTRIPGIVAFRAAMAKFAPNVTPDGSTMTGWAAGKLLEHAGRNLATPTSQSLLDGLWSINGDDLDGITGPLTYPKDAKRNGDTMQLCYWVVQVKAGKWSAPGAGDRQCKPWDKGLL